MYFIQTDDMNFIEEPSSRDEIKCDACGELIDVYNSYLLMRGFKCHLKKQCIMKVYKKILKTKDDFELAILDDKDYGIV